MHAFDVFVFYIYTPHFPRRVGFFSLRLPLFRGIVGYHRNMNEQSVTARVGHSKPVSKRVCGDRKK